MKKIILFFTVLLSVSMFMSCGSDDEGNEGVTNVKSYETSGISSSPMVSDSISFEVGDYKGKKVLMSYQYNFRYKITDGMSTSSGNISESRYNNETGVLSFSGNEAMIDVDGNSNLSTTEKSYVKLKLENNDSVTMSYELYFSDSRVGKINREENCNMNKD